MTTEQALRRAGLSDRIIEELLRPFLSGVLADRALETSSHVSAMIARSFVRGRIGVPAGGMAALPAAIAAPLPRTLLHLGTPVTSISPGLVRTPAGDLRCRAVLVAVDPGTATALLPALGPIRTRALTTYYHSVTEPPLAEPILLLDGDRREIVANTVVISRAAPTYAPAGRHLVATSVVGPTPPPEPVIRAELGRLYGCRTDDWEHLTTVTLPAALPAAPPRAGSAAPAGGARRRAVRGRRPPGQPVDPGRAGQRLAGRRRHRAPPDARGLSRHHRLGLRCYSRGAGPSHGRGGAASGARQRSRTRGHAGHHVPHRRGR